MNNKNGIFSIILAVLISLIAAVVVWLFAKYDIASDSVAAISLLPIFRLIL